MKVLVAQSGLIVRLFCTWNSSGKNTGVGCHFLLQEIFPTQGLNLVLLHCRQMLYHLSYQGSLVIYLQKCEAKNPCPQNWERAR